MSAPQHTADTAGPGYENLLVERRDAVALITLNRPKALNALCDALTAELTAAFAELEADDEIGAVVITGSSKAFAAGADIAEMRPKSFTDVYLEDFITSTWQAPARCRKPVIAAVAGYALGGGAELAMMCDLIIAAENAKFGQPEITIGILPGAGGTQRLTRSVGKAKAMDMVLTGRMVDAHEAERIGIVSRVVTADELVDEAVKVAQAIASFNRPAVLMAKEAVNSAFETPLAEGLRLERRLFHAAFSTEGKDEGMGAFLEKRKPKFNHR